MQKKNILGLLFCICFINVFSQVNITATAGTLSGSYNELRLCFNAINAGTHRGVLNITITANTTETATAVLNASGTGSASYTSVLIQPSGNPIISADLAAFATIRLDGSDNVTIDGLNDGTNSLTIQNLSTSDVAQTSTIRFFNDAANNLIANCNILGSATVDGSTTGGNIFFHSGVTTGNDNNIIRGNNIGPAGTNLPTKCIFGSGSTSSVGIGNSNITIENNNIYDYFSQTSLSAGIRTNNGCNTWRIIGNRFFQSAVRTLGTPSTGPNHRAIDLSSASTTVGMQNALIQDNIIGYSSPNQTGTYTLFGSGSNSRGKFGGIFFDGIPAGANSIIEGNRIENVSVSNTGSLGNGATNTPFVGIVINVGLATVRNNRIGSLTAINNLVFATTSTSTTSRTYGIYVVGDQAVTIENNEIGGIAVSNTLNNLQFQGIYLANGSATISCQGNTVGGSVANSISMNAVNTPTQVVGIYAEATATIENNAIRNLTSNQPGSGANTASVIGIVTTNNTRNYVVRNNQISTLTNTNTTAGYEILGIQFNGSNGTNIVSGNLVQNLISNSTSSATTSLIVGIRIAGADATISNNIVNLGLNNVGNNVIEGINILGGNNNMWYNTVQIEGTTNNSNNSYCFLGSSTGTRNYRNNIFYNTRSNTGTGQNYAIGIGLLTNLSINNNLYFVSGTNGRLGLATTTSTNHNSLASWQGFTGQDAASISSIPQFVSSTDFALQTCSPAINAGTSVVVTIDYLNNIRPFGLGPDMGAFENTTSSGDASVTPSSVCAGSNVTLSASGFPAGLFYQWQSSTDNFLSNVVDIPMATTAASFITNSLTNTISFRLAVNCNAAPPTISRYTDTVSVTVNALSNLLAADPPVGVTINDNKNISADGITFSDASNCRRFANVVPNGPNPVTGAINSRVHGYTSVQFYNAQPYVQRVIDIVPQTSPVNATADIVLYYTDAEFVAFNALRGSFPPLPTVATGGNADPNKFRVRVTRYSGTPTTNPSQPSQYTLGNPTRLVPGPANVNWNGNYWEITLPNITMGGFYVHTNGYGVLPVSIDYLKGQKIGTANKLNWKVTCQSAPEVTMELQRSSDGINFFAIHSETVSSVRCEQPFEFTDRNPLSGKNYYRLKLRDINEKDGLSNVLLLLQEINGFELRQIVPNPAIGNFINAVYSSATFNTFLVKVTDILGKTIFQSKLTALSGQNNWHIPMGYLGSGVYLIRVENLNGQTQGLLKFVK